LDTPQNVSSGDLEAPAQNQRQLAVQDIVQGAMSWRIWTMLARGDIAQRYRRSRLGEFWLTLSMAITIAAIGTVYSTLFKIDTAQFIPFLACGLVSWQFINSLLNECAVAFVTNADTIRNYRKPLSIALYRTIARNVIILGHNLIIIPVVLLYYAVPVTWAILLLPLGLLIVLLMAGSVGIILATLCTRFRDFPPVVSNILQLAFFVTPVMFTPELLSGNLWTLAYLNPFANFVEILRAPMLGKVPELFHYGMALLETAASAALAFLLYEQFRRRIIYWL
jgi:ABC-type polysaccharide/polyol phosphate export permease